MKSVNKTNRVRTMLGVALCAGLLIFSGCKNNKDETEEEAPKVDENGLTKEITDLIPKEILDEIQRLGMPIYGGNNPPMLTGGKTLTGEKAEKAKADYVAKAVGQNEHPNMASSDKLESKQVNSTAWQQRLC